MSLPPAKWSAKTSIQHTIADQISGPVRKLVLATAWASRNPQARERFRTELHTSDLETLWYHTEDGWQAPVYHLPARAGATGEPVLLSPGLGFNVRTLDVQHGRSLVRHLHDSGFEVFVLTHRASQSAIPPQSTRGFCFDDIVSHDVPAAIALVKNETGAERVHWVGHGLGGQLLVGHAAFDGHRDIAGAVNMCAATSFSPLRATARRIAAVAHWAPPHWRLPVRKVRDILTAATRSADLVHFSRRIEGPVARSILIDGTEDLAVGLMQQVAKWHEVGSLVTLDDRFDYTAGLKGRRLNLLTIAASDDKFCTPDQAHAAIEMLESGCGASFTLDEGWGHLDPLAGADAARVVFPRIETWLQRHNERCWK